MKRIVFNVEKKEEGLNNVNSLLFPPHFLGCICGKPGSGKTSLLKFMLKEKDLLYKKFDYVLILSPSFMEYKDLYLPDKNFCSELDYNWIDNWIKRINEKKNYNNVLFVIDDLIATLFKNKFSKELLQFIFNRRHLLKKGMISIILTSQKYNYIPTVVRSNITFLFMFKLNNIDLVNIERDLIFDPNEFRYALNMVFKKDDDSHNFLYIRFDKNKYFSNFDLII